MKTMICSELGGACDETFSAETFDEIAQLSQQHGRAMFDKGDAAHLDAMQAMQELMKKPGAMDAWFDERRRLFDSLPDDES